MRESIRNASASLALTLSARAQVGSRFPIRHVRRRVLLLGGARRLVGPGQMVRPAKAAAS